MNSVRGENRHHHDVQAHGKQLNPVLGENSAEHDDLERNHVQGENCENHHPEVECQRSAPQYAATNLALGTDRKSPQVHLHVKNVWDSVKGSVD